MTIVKFMRKFKLTQNGMQSVNGIITVLAQIQLWIKFESLVIFFQTICRRIVTETFEMYMQHRWQFDNFILL